MNSELITALESTLIILSAHENTGSQTVDYEILTAKSHVQRAIEWEKARPKIEKAAL